MTTENENSPLHVFRFHVEFQRVTLDGSGQPAQIALCHGAFSECSGLDATMEPKVIKEGGRNYGAHQRAGPVTFGTVILKRGMTTTRDLWSWFSWVNQQAKYSFRLNVTIKLMPPDPADGSAPEPAWTFRLDHALPVKFKPADLNARGSEVGIEEIHLAHEGLSIS